MAHFALVEIWLCCQLFLTTLACQPDFDLSPYYSEGMVFQANSMAMFWGTSNAFNPLTCPIKVSIECEDKTYMRRASLLEGKIGKV